MKTWPIRESRAANRGFSTASSSWIFMGDPEDDDEDEEEEKKKPEEDEDKEENDGEEEEVPWKVRAPTGDGDR